MENFDKLDKMNTPEEVKVEGAAEKKSDFKEAVVGAARQALKENQNLVEVLEANSESIELVKLLVYTDSGNIKNGAKIKKDDGTEGYEKIPVPMKVGAIIKNVGPHPFGVMQRKYKKTENGFEVAGEEEVSLVPGAEIALAQRDLTKFCSLPSISMKMKGNVTLVPSGKISKSEGKLTLDEMLASFYVKFDDKDSRRSTDSSLQLQVGEKTAKGWVVKPEFQEILGFLMNGDPAKQKRSGGTSVSKNAQNALYVASLLAKAGEKAGVDAPTVPAAEAAPAAPAEKKASKKKA